ncbi:hypothetical protein GW17_00061542 [Ensete ventricosum]|nr:hypothetical protein GW17_00061542 [Ensete ventricosum]RZS28603.1 hypothetical protein BHM03_00062241 [Ensete ventricosum]
MARDGWRSGIPWTCENILLDLVEQLMDLADLFPQGIGGVGRYGVEVGAGLNRIARATLRPSWRRSRGGCVSFRNLELWWLRLKRGLSVRGYR